MPLALGLVPEDMKAKVLDVLIKAIEAHDYHLTTGIFGTKYLFQALSNAGRDDVAYRVANQRTFPGWGFMLEKGATTLWEHWEFSDNTFSHNHPMFGSVSEWFYKSLAGIQPDPYWPDFKEFLIKPSIVGDLTWVKCHHDTMYGRIESNWRRDSNKLTMEVTVPANSSTPTGPLSFSSLAIQSGRIERPLRIIPTNPQPLPSARAPIGLCRIYRSLSSLSIPQHLGSRVNVIFKSIVLCRRLWC